MVDRNSTDHPINLASTKTLFLLMPNRCLPLYGHCSLHILFELMWNMNGAESCSIFAMMVSQRSFMNWYSTIGGSCCSVPSRLPLAEFFRVVRQWRGPWWSAKTKKTLSWSLHTDYSVCLTHPETSIKVVACGKRRHSPKKVASFLGKRVERQMDCEAHWRPRSLVALQT